MRPALGLILPVASIVALSCAKKNPVYGGRYLAERTEDGGTTWARDQGGLAARGSTSRADEELFYSKRMFEAGVTMCNQSAIADRSEVRVRGFHFVKEGSEPITDAELRTAVINAAKRGSSPAQAMALQFLNRVRS